MKTKNSSILQLKTLKKSVEIKRAWTISTAGLNIPLSAVKVSSTRRINQHGRVVYIHAVVQGSSVKPSVNALNRHKIYG